MKTTPDNDKGGKERPSPQRRPRGSLLGFSTPKTYDPRWLE